METVSEVSDGTPNVDRGDAFDGEVSCSLTFESAATFRSHASPLSEFDKLSGISWNKLGIDRE